MYEKIENTESFIEDMIEDALNFRASDIHIEPFGNFFLIRYRIDGVLKEAHRISKENESALVTAIKIKAGIDIAEKRLPQDGRFKYCFYDKAIDIRVASISTNYGEMLDLRLLDDRELLSSHDLAYDELLEKELKRIAALPSGLVLVTGPTGSGKTTTIYSLLQMIDRKARKVTTIEDPIEYLIEDVNQIQVNRRAGLDFEGGLRAILRHDPDVIFVGEIRDKETAETCVRASITGHLVLSTLHTNDAQTALIRLKDMGVETYLVASSLDTIINQRLIRVLCPSCKIGRPLREDEISFFENFLDHPPEKIYYPGSCPSCNSGYRGRTSIFEIMSLDRESRREIRRDIESFYINDPEKLGGKDIFKRGLDLVVSGKTSLDELKRVVVPNG